MIKHSTYTEQREGRDRGKSFYITEMDAWDAEWWAIRALGVAQRGGMNIGDDVVAMGMQAIVAYGLQEFLKGFVKGNPQEIKPLLDEMFSCVEILPHATDSSVRRGIIKGDIEEVATIFGLRLAVLTLHTNFSSADDQSKGSNTGTPATSTTIQSPIRTSRRSSGQSSHPAKQA